MKIPLGISSFLRQVAKTPEVTLHNGYFEEDPTNLIDQTAIVRRPGLKTLLSVGTGPIREIFYRRDLFNNAFFVISDDTLYKVARTAEAAFTTTAISGTLATADVPSMAAYSGQLFITDQSLLWHTDGSSGLNSIDTPDDISFSLLAYIGGYIVCVEKDNQRFYWINPGDITIDPLNFAEAEGAPDGIVDILVLGDQMYLFGKDTIEVWYLSGDATAPFQRLQGKLLDSGATPGTATIVPNQDTLVFVGIDGIVRVGPDLQRVSTPGVEERIRQAIRLNILANL